MTDVAVRTSPLPPQAHTGRPWRIHEIAPDFRLEDVWALPTPGGPDDLAVLVEQMAAGGDESDFPVAYRVLFAIRWWLGGLLRLDDESTGVGDRVASVRDRLPDDLRTSVGPAFGDYPFTPVYLTHDEFVAEIANSTVHGLLHLGWVEDPVTPGRYRAQMAVLVKPNGRFGEAYLRFIKPFRYLLVYPALLRTIGRRWAARAKVSA
jgi:hypothetical protein